MTSPQNILIMGGTRFFGLRLAAQLIEEGHHVTIATRGNTADPFGNAVQRLQMDRTVRSDLAQTIGQQDWDVVYDQICFTPTAAQDAIDVLTGRVGRYVFTSSLSVYDQNQHADTAESDFDPTSYDIDAGNAQEEVGYAEGKRLAEAVFYQRADFPVAAVRFPIVLGPDDYTERLLNPVQDVAHGRVLRMTNPDARMCLISSGEAASFLHWLAALDTAHYGPFNACSDGTITPRELVHLIEEATGNTAVVTTTPDEARFSLVSLAQDWTMSNAKATQAGFEFAPLKVWLGLLINQFAQQT